MLRLCFAALLTLGVAAFTPASAFDGNPRPAERNGSFTQDQLIKTGHEFFGQTSAGIARALTELFAQFGLPDGYVLGEEGSGAIIGGLRYGEGALQYRTMPPSPVFWQGPSFGWDFGGSGSRVMMLVYNMKDPQELMQRFTGVDGSAYLVGGVSMTVMAADESFIVPVRTGVGARLGVSLGYLKFTPEPTWNPF